MYMNNKRYSIIKLNAIKYWVYAPITANIVSKIQYFGSGFFKISPAEINPHTNSSVPKGYILAIENVVKKLLIVMSVNAKNPAVNQP